MTHPHMITDPAAAVAFATGGNARFTLVSQKSGKRYTYRLRQPDVTKPVFVQLLTGPDNTADYEYLGYITLDFPGWVKAGKKGNPEHPAFKAIHWAMKEMVQGHMPEQLEFWHEGRCARCARVLTDPVSIERGLGPECAGKA